MITKIIADGKKEFEFVFKMRKRAQNVNREVTDTVSAIMDDVHNTGDTAVQKYTRQFDGVCPEVLEVPAELIKSSVKTIDKDFYATLQKSAENIRDFHERQVTQSWLTTGEDGTITGQRVRALKCVGIYVPGGTAAYPSSVLMNAIPAKVAGVKEIIMVTPPMKNGQANPNILTAAFIAGVDRVFLCGGAQAVAALAYGTQSIPKVDKIVGPGNIYVATAKKLLFGVVDIDMIAGPSEILVIADSGATPAFIAADLLSQAEHDRLSSSILITTDDGIANGAISEITKQMEKLSRKEIAAEAIKNYGAVIVCGDIKKAVELSNLIAPEHLELHVENPLELLGGIDNAGSVFAGQYSPEALGDYYAGPNHVLPTDGTARFFSPLGTDSFVKKSSFIYYNKDALLKAKEDIMRFAATEGLDAHANSIGVRFYEDE